MSIIYFFAFLLFGAISLLPLASHAEGETLEETVMAALRENDCDVLQKGLPELAKTQPVHLLTLAERLRSGNCFEIDLGKSYEATLSAQAKDVPFSSLELGLFYSRGWHVQQNEAHARKYFRLGLLNNVTFIGSFDGLREFTSAMVASALPTELDQELQALEQKTDTPEKLVAFAQELMEKRGEPLPEEIALIALQRAAYQGKNADAHYLLAKWYRDNGDTEKRANNLFSAAALMGHGDAQREVGLAYFSGTKSDISVSYAYAMLLRSAKQGKTSRDILEKYAGYLNAVEMESALAEAEIPLPRE